MEQLSGLTIHELHDLLVKGEILPIEIVESVGERIEKLESEINAFIDIFLEDAKKQAIELEKELKNIKNLPYLFGIPVAVKDNIVVKGYDTTCGSRILLGFKSPYDATVIKKLKANKGIIIGKTNMDEFAMGSTGEFSYFGATKNPVNPEHVPGGSSSGSAASVKAGEAIAALGSDTGGSIRQPASFTGTYGLKPTYGRVSRYGLVAFASSLDQIGVIARDTLDTAILFTTLSGFDPMDSTSLDIEVPQLEEIFRDYENYRPTIGIPKEYFEHKGLEKEVREIIFQNIEKLSNMGFEIQEISLPHTKYAVAVYQLLCTSEASSNLARYDGVRYGFRAKDYKNLQDMYLKTRNQGFGEEVKRRILLGTFALSAGYYEAYYLKAQKVRRLIKKDFEKAFEKVEIILTPTSPVTAPKLGEHIKDPLTLYLMDIYTVTANLAGLPAFSIPAGKNSKGLPVGIQIIAPAFKEERLFKFARFFEENIYSDKSILP